VNGCCGQLDYELARPCAGPKDQGELFHAKLAAGERPEGNDAVEIEEAIYGAGKSARSMRLEFPVPLPASLWKHRKQTLKRLRKGESNKSDLGGVL